MTNEELATPPTDLEVAELLAAASRPDYQLSKKGLDVLRRLAFDRDRLKAENEQLKSKSIKMAGSILCDKFEM